MTNFDIISMFQNKEMLSVFKKLTQIQDVVKTSNGYVLVDSIYTIDHDFETMVFSCDEKGENIDFSDLDCEHYSNIRDMAEGHKAMVERWKNK